MVNKQTIDRLNREIALFKSYMKRSAVGDYTVEQIDAYGFSLCGREKHQDRPIDILFLALTHGNEVGGVAVLNSVIETIENDQITAPLNIGFVLVNVAAALQGQRYTDRDMNRSFGFRSPTIAEAERVIDIERLIEKSRYHLDLHQTTERTRSPFFVFKHSAAAAYFSSCISPEIPVVTHRNTIFSTMAGMTSDEFAHQAGCVGISIEIGQAGFNGESIEVGKTTAINAIEHVQLILNDGVTPPLNPQQTYTWKHIEPYPECHVELVPGLVNFDPVDAQQPMGVGGDGENVYSPVSGRLLFPKYVKPGEDRPPELFRILTKVDYSTHNDVSNH